jgi:hypothetical protein
MVKKKYFFIGKNNLIGCKYKEGNHGGQLKKLSANFRKNRLKICRNGKKLNVNSPLKYQQLFA